MRRLIILAVCVVVAVGAFIVARGSGNDSSSGRGSASSAASSSSAAPASGARAFTIRLRQHQPVGGKQSITVHRGDHVTITVRSDETVPAHLHGYEIEHEVSPGRPGVFRFVATDEGVFEMELHTDPEAKVAQLNVEP